MLKSLFRRLFPRVSRTTQEEADLQVERLRVECVAKERELLQILPTLPLERRQAIVEAAVQVKEEMEARICEIEKENGK